MRINNVWEQQQTYGGKSCQKGEGILEKRVCCQCTWTSAKIPCLRTLSLAPDVQPFLCNCETLLAVTALQPLVSLNHFYYLGYIVFFCLSTLNKYVFKSRWERLRSLHWFWYISFLIKSITPKASCFIIHVCISVFHSFCILMQVSRLTGLV